MDAIFFDLDNTLVLWRIPIHQEIVTRFLKVMGVENPEHFYQNYWHDVEERLEKLAITAEDYLTVWRPVLFEVIVKTKKELMPKYAYLAPGALKLLRRVKKPKALVSNSLAESVHNVLRFFKIEKYFDYIYERDFYNEDEHKPKRIVAEKVCNALGIRPNKNILMLGDSEVDIEFAHNSGLTAIAIGRYHDDADYYYPNLEEFYRHIRKF
ncbi:hypothetical protein DRN74_03540 [Candidatus Micrarchaeota archaeon]|nr:MAG: hypothetical protein DRN74_03540 [Candidatus Micrarchaeota archaeon]